jgi:predicted alpha/beta-hydrolase family hydrolase
MEEPFEAEGVRGTLHRPEKSNGEALVLTHGASSNCNAPLLVRLARTFSDAGVLVLRYDLPYRQQRPNGPPSPASAARDRIGVGQAIEAVRKFSAGRIFAGGHSYGGRQTAMAAADHPGRAAGLLLLSYPLHPPGKPDQKRTSYFPQLQTPALFVSGSSDPFGSLQEMREAIALIPVRTELMGVEKTGHDLKRAADLGGEILARLLALAD